MKKLAIAAIIICIILTIISCKPAGKAIQGVSDTGSFQNFPGNVPFDMVDGKIVAKYYASSTALSDPEFIDTLADFSSELGSKYGVYIEAQGLGTYQAKTTQQMKAYLSNEKIKITGLAIAGQDSTVIDNNNGNTQQQYTPATFITASQATTVEDNIVAVVSCENQEDKFYATTSCPNEYSLVEIAGYAYQTQTNGATAVYACGKFLNTGYDYYARQDCYQGDTNLGILFYAPAQSQDTIAVNECFYGRGNDIYSSELACPADTVDNGIAFNLFSSIPQADDTTGDDSQDTAQELTSEFLLVNVYPNVNSITVDIATTSAQITGVSVTDKTGLTIGTTQITSTTTATVSNIPGTPKVEYLVTVSMLGLTAEGTVTVNTLTETGHEIGHEMDLTDIQKLIKQRPPNCNDGTVQTDEGEQCELPNNWNNVQEGLWCDSYCQIRQAMVTGAGTSSPPPPPPPPPPGSGAGGAGSSSPPPGPGNFGWGPIPPPGAGAAGGAAGQDTGSKCGDNRVDQPNYAGVFEQCDPELKGFCDANCQLIKPLFEIIPNIWIAVTPLILTYTPNCGDGLIQANLGEECDDGNTQNGDGCSENCWVETRPLYSCHMQDLYDEFAVLTLEHVNLWAGTCGIKIGTDEYSGILKDNIGQAFILPYEMTEKISVCFQSNPDIIYVTEDTCGNDVFLYDFYASTEETKTNFRDVSTLLEIYDVTQHEIQYETILPQTVLAEQAKQFEQTTFKSQYYLLPSIGAPEDGTCTQSGNSILGTDKLGNDFTETNECIDTQYARKWHCEDTVPKRNFKIIDCSPNDCMNGNCVSQIIADGEYTFDPELVTTTDAGFLFLTAADTGIISTLGITDQINPKTGFVGYVGNKFVVIGGTAKDTTSTIKMFLENLASLIGNKMYTLFGDYWTAYTYDKTSFAGKLNIPAGISYLGFPFTVKDGTPASLFGRASGISIYDYDGGIGRANPDTNWHVWHSNNAFPSDITTLPLAFAIKTDRAITSSFTGTLKTAAAVRAGWNLMTSTDPFQTRATTATAKKYYNAKTKMFEQVPAEINLPPGTAYWNEQSNAMTLRRLAGATLKSGTGAAVGISSITGGVTVNPIQPSMEPVIYLCEFTTTSTAPNLTNQRLYLESTSPSCSIPSYNVVGYPTQPVDWPNSTQTPVPVSISAGTNLGAIARINPVELAYAGQLQPKLLYYCPVPIGTPTGARINWMRLEIADPSMTNICTYAAGTTRPAIAGPIGWINGIDYDTTGLFDLTKILGMVDQNSNALIITDPADGMQIPSGITQPLIPDFFQNYNPVNQYHEFGWARKICVQPPQTLSGWPQPIDTVTDTGIWTEVFPQCTGTNTIENIYCDLSTASNWAQGTDVTCPSGMICQNGNCITSTAVCGNGLLEQGEQCDDNNTISGDGCSSNCTIEQMPLPPNLNFEQYFGSVTNVVPGDLVTAVLGNLTFGTITDASSMYGMSPVFLVGGTTAGQPISFSVKGQFVTTSPFTPLAVTRLDLNYIPPGMPVCGNSIIEQGEQCDPPNNVTCNSQCQNITGPPVLATCNDTIRNQDETDIDCGGAICPKCLNGNQCTSNTDCRSGYCKSGICAARPAHSGGGGGGGGGGSGTKWYDTQPTAPAPSAGGGPGGWVCDWICTEYGPCTEPLPEIIAQLTIPPEIPAEQAGLMSRNCYENIYPNCTIVPKPPEYEFCTLPPKPQPSCADGMQNQDETYADCGGTICIACDPGLPCLTHRDCITGYCDPNTRRCGWPPVIEAPLPPAPEPTYLWVWLTVGSVAALGAAGALSYFLWPRPPINGRLKDVRNYAKTYLDKGVSKDKIGSKLKNAGWSDKDLKSIFKKL